MYPKNNQINQRYSELKHCEIKFKTMQVPFQSCVIPKDPGRVDGLYIFCMKKYMCSPKIKYLHLLKKRLSTNDTQSRLLLPFEFRRIIG